MADIFDRLTYKPKKKDFTDWYSGVSKKWKLSPDPDDPQHYYDYRKAYQEGVRNPDETGHWPSKYKLPGHPREIIDGINTRTGEKAWDIFDEIPSKKKDIFDVLDDTKQEDIFDVIKPGKKSYPKTTATKEFIRGIPSLAKETAKEAVLDTTAAMAYMGAGAVKGVTLGYVDPSQALEKTPLGERNISKPIAGVTGQLLGAMAPIVGTSVTVGATLAKTGILRGVRPVLRHMVQSGVTGGIYGAAHKPEEEGLANRASNALEASAFFIVLSGSGELLDRIGALFRGKNLSTEVRSIEESSEFRSLHSEIVERMKRGGATEEQAQQATDLGLKIAIEEGGGWGKVTAKDLRQAKKAIKDGQRIALGKEPPPEAPRGYPVKPQGIPEAKPAKPTETKLPEQPTEFRPEIIGNKAHDYVRTEYPQLAQMLENRKFEVSLESLQGALSSAVAAGEDIKLRGGGFEEAEDAALVEFNQAIRRAPPIEPPQPKSEPTAMTLKPTRYRPFKQYFKEHGDGRPKSVVRAEYEDLILKSQAGIQPKFTKGEIRDLAESLQRRHIKKHPSESIPSIASFEPRAQEILQRKFTEASARYEERTPGMQRFIREVTGQTKPQEPKISKWQAFKESLKIRERTSREAAQYERDRILAAQKMVRKIQKADIEEITHEARIEINKLQDELKNTKTIDGLRELNDRIQAIKETGKEQVSANKELKKRLFEANKETLLKTIQGNKPPVARKPITEPVRARPGKVLRLHGLRPSRWLDQLDGGQDFRGPFHQTFYDSSNRAYSNEVDMGKQGTIQGLEILKKHGITNKDLAQTMTVGEVTLSMDAAMHIYGGFNNIETRAAIALGNRIGVSIQQRVIEKLPDNYKKAADELIAAMDENYPRLRLAFLEFTNGKEDLGKVAGNYIPMRRTDVNYETNEKELMDDFANRKKWKKAYAERGFTKARLELPPEAQRPIRLGLSEIYFEHVPKREHFIAAGNLIKDLQRLANDNGITNALRDYHGREYVDELQAYVNRIGNPTVYRSHTNLEKLIRVVRKKGVVINLGFNLVTMAKQTPSLALMLGEVGPIELLGGVQEVVTNFPEINKFVEKNDPQMASRNIERELEEMKKARPAGPGSLIHSLEASSMKGIVFFDKIVTRTGWIAKYRSMIRAGASHQEAVEEAQKSVLRTQPASAPKDIAQFYASNEFLNLFTQFTNQLNQMWNMLTYDIPMRTTMGRYKAALLGATGLAIDMAAIYTMSHGRLPTKKEDFTEAALDTTLSMIPVIGPMINSWRKGFDGLPATFAAARKTAYEFPKYLIKAVHKSDQKALVKALDRGVYAAAFTYGIPYNQLRRTLEGIVELGTGDTEDLRRLVYSEYQLKEKTQKAKKPKLRGLSKRSGLKGL